MSFDRPGETVTRSRDEIGDTLSEISARRATVTATLNLDDQDELFVTQIRHVDAKAEHYIVDYGLNKSLNARLLAARKLSLSAELDDAHIAWAARSLTHVSFDERSAIRLELPEYLVRRRERVKPRIKVPHYLGMKCVVECPGYVPFELEIFDISLEGQGMLLPSSAVELEPGMILQGCSIHYPGREPIKVDLEIRHVEDPGLAFGDVRRRVGCRFVGTPPDVGDLVRLFRGGSDQPR